jgi:hypothetical protein
MNIDWLNPNYLPTPVLENAKLMQELRDLRQDYENLQNWNYNENYRTALKRELDKAKEDILERINQLI